MRRLRIRFGLALPAWVWLLVFFVVPIGVVVWYSFGYKPSIFATNSNDRLSFDRYVEALSPTFFATFQNTLWVGVAGTVLCLLIGAPVADLLAELHAGPLASVAFRPGTTFIAPLDASNEPSGVSGLVEHVVSCQPTSWFPCGG